MNENSNKSFGQTLNEAPTEEVRLENFSINHTACSAICVSVFTCDLFQCSFCFFFLFKTKSSSGQGHYMDSYKGDKLNQCTHSDSEPIICTNELLWLGL